MKPHHLYRHKLPNRKMLYNAARSAKINLESALKILEARGDWQEVYLRIQDAQAYFNRVQELVDHRKAAGA
jgi:hypothetical protein